MIQCVLNVQNRQTWMVKGVSPRHLDVVILITIKGPWVQGRETSMQVNRKVGLIIMLVSPHPYCWVVLPLSVNMLLETFMFRHEHSLSSQLFPTFIWSLSSYSWSLYSFSDVTAGEQSLCTALTPGTRLLLFHKHHHTGHSSVTQVCLPPPSH